MARSCAVIPKVLNQQGEKVDSKLFMDLSSFFPTNREEAVRVYKITKSQEFIQKWNPKLVLDNNGEPTIRSMLQQTNLSDYISERAILDKLNRDIGAYQKGTNNPAIIVKNPENLSKLVQKAIQFNQNSDFSDEYVAIVVDASKEGSNEAFIGIKVEKRDKTNSSKADQMEYNEKLNKILREILAQHGISIGTLTELERRQGINGVTDFSQASNAANGLVELIRLADGIRGEKALPEEFAHFVIEAIGNNNPLVSRLLNLIISNNLAKEIIGEDYETYDRLYNGNKIKLAKEAAGKLLAKHLLQAVEIPNKPYKNLLQRLISYIKNFFSKISASSIQKAMREADKKFGTLARDILDGSMNRNINIKNITESSLYYNTTERIARDRKLLQSIINNELKRLKVYESRDQNGRFSANQVLLIDKLEIELANNNEIEGIYAFADNALNTLKSLDARLVEIERTPGATINQKAKVLRDVRNYLYSYKHIIADVKTALINEEKFSDNRYGERVRVVIDDITKLLDDLFIKYNNASMPLFVDFLKPFIGTGIEIPYGKYRGRTITIDDLVKVDESGIHIMAEKDISFFDRWLDSMADSSNLILKIMDQAVKKSKENARLETIEVIKQIQEAAIKLEQAGVKDTDWMFERFSTGKLTGRYIAEINYGLFKEEVDKMQKRLKEKYGENPVGEDAEAYIEERRAWFNANMETVNGIRRPKKSIYGNKVFENLTAAQREFYDTIMSIKEKLDAFLPENYTTLTNTVKIRKDLIERIKASDDIKSGIKSLWEDTKDQFVRRGDDTEIGDRATIKDFEGNEVQILPIYYTKLRKGESIDDISTDIVSTLSAYAAMANDFNQMNKVIDVLELSRDMLRDNLEVGKTRGEKSLKEKFTTMGRTIESKVLKPKDSRRIIERLNDYFEMQVYGRYIADEGTFFGENGPDKAKVADFVNRVTALNSLAINVLSGVSNVTTGTVMMRIESFSGEFFNELDTIWADKEYSKAMIPFLGEIGNRVKISKMALWDELFNVLQDYETDLREMNFDRKTWFSRLCNTKALFLTNNAGEHWLQNRTSLALAHKFKMKAPNGTIVNLWDAMEVVYIDPNNKSLGAKLQVKDGYTKKDGTAFTKDDIIKFSRKVAAINQRMHGIYNRIDRSAVQRLAIGRMAMLFRKFIKPSLNRRFKSATYNFDLDHATEGYYMTTGRFLWQLIKELKEGQFAVIANFDNLSQEEKNNIWRTVTEVGHLFILSLILGCIDWPDDKDRPWLIKMVEYQTRRLYTEIGAMTPGPQIPDEGFRILKSPAAAINTFEGTIDLIGLLNPFNYEWAGHEDAIIQSGRFKGETRAMRLIYQSPLIPMNNTVYRWLHPEEGIPFFKS